MILERLGNTSILSLKEYNEEHLWSTQPDSEKTMFGFVRGFRFRQRQDCSTVAKMLEEGVAICAPKYIAGPEHVRRILIQASEYWRLEKKLARNKSIDLLMRITCQSQISSALKLSGVSYAKQLALFGLIENAREADRWCSRLLAAGAIPDDSILKLTSERELFLKRFHDLPRWCMGSQIVDLLEEKSVLLVFSK